MKLSLKTALPAAALAVIGYAVLATSANASATSQLNKCRYDTKQKVVECCDRILRNKKKPFWMVENNQNCRSAAKCVAVKNNDTPFAITHVVTQPNKGKLKRRCFVQIQFENGGGREIEKVVPKQPDRSFNQSFNRSFN